MTLRTPRRRISPRAKRRCRVIRDFFRRALGSASQQDIKINSSIAVNVTDIKHKIVGIEHRLNEVSKHCQDLACVESGTCKGTDRFLEPECSCQHEVACSVNDSEPIDRIRNISSNTKVIYKPMDTLRRKSDESDYISHAYREERKHMTLPANMSYEQSHFKKLRQRKSKGEDRIHVGYEREPNLQKRRTKSTLETFGADASYATTSYHSLGPPPHTECLRPALRKQSKHHEYTDDLIHDELSGKKYKRNQRNKTPSPERHHEELRDSHGVKRDRSRKVKRKRSKIDQEFITELIQRQYRPTKVLGRKDSEVSQFSVPVCRDQEFSIKENIQEGTDLCSCCYDHEPRRAMTHRTSCHSPSRTPHRSSQRRHHQHHDCRSMCDTRLYSAKRSRPHRFRHVDIYNDSTLYDVVPVKEKPSPKSRRRFVEDDIIGYEYYREVPPSPRTHRPRLNLKAQNHADYDEYMMMKHQNKAYIPNRHKRIYGYVDQYLESDEINCDLVHHKEKIKQKLSKVQTSMPTDRENCTMSNLQTPSFENNRVIATAENSFNKTQEMDAASDKTDKALTEIKDILQSFLQEIKKDAVPPDKNNSNPEIVPAGTGVTANTEASKIVGPPQALPIGPTYTVAQCSIPTTFPVPPFTNTCCYPMLPMCPMNCMPNLPQNQSCSCHFSTGSKETTCHCQKDAQETDKNNETEELIKEIYKFVTHNPQTARKNKKEDSRKKLTSRSVGGDSRVSRHDANVATSAMKCYSKSCEAIGSRMIGETSYTGTHSDTVLEKLSLDVSRSDSELTTEVILQQKSKTTNKFTNVLRSIGLFKKKKSDTESSSFDIDLNILQPKEKRVPYRQEVYNYSMYGQEYYQPHDPPYAPRYENCRYVPPPPGCEHRGPYYAPPPPGTYTPHRVHQQTIPEHEPNYHHHHTHPSAPPYHDPYDHYHSPQGPLCLKEIEVKSTGTQSERKMSFLRKLGRRTPPGTSVRSDYSPPPPRFTEGTQTAQNLPKEPSKPLFPAWQKFQDKVRSDLNEDPLMYGYKTKQKLMDGDKKLKTAMVKKMFYKRNPFSPNNLIIRTLLGNDPSSFGEPNVTLKPRIFF